MNSRGSAIRVTAHFIKNVLFPAFTLEGFYCFANSKFWFPLKRMSNSLLFFDSPVTQHSPFFTRQWTTVKLYISLLGISLLGPRCRPLFGIMPPRGMILYQATFHAIRKLGWNLLNQHSPASHPSALSQRSPTLAEWGGEGRSTLPASQPCPCNPGPFAEAGKAQAMKWSHELPAAVQQQPTARGQGSV